jgi:hypothetical protein
MLIPSPRFILSALTLLACFAGCTAIHVEALSRSELREPHVCIEENPAVILADFLPVLRQGFETRGISTETYRGRAPESCPVTVTYTARQSWDIVRFLSKAEVWIWHEGRRIAYAEYHLRGGGGYALTKYEHTATKMKPVMERLLKEFDAGMTQPLAAATLPAAAP